MDEGSGFPHILADTCRLSFDYSRSHACELVSPVVLIYVSLVTNDVEHLFICLSSLCISSLEK